MTQYHLRRRASGHASVWIAAGIVGLSAILFAHLINYIQKNYFKLFESNAVVTSMISPILFLIATALVRLYAPDAKGSGIPQVMEAIELSGNPDTKTKAWRTHLVSLRTAFIKILSASIGVLGGASIGREGPTVQIASSGFAWVARITRRKFSEVNLQSYLIAGAASGVAAAFNTPLAGITFAIEELAEGAFGPFRQTIMLAVIIAGITAQALAGDYLYFGHPTFEKANLWILPQAIALGIVAGSLGLTFAKLLSTPSLTRLPEKWWPRALACGIICSAIGYFTHGASAGSGYEITRATLSSSNTEKIDILFPVWKIVTTVLSYLSGMAGGIFSPCLSIGAGIGMTFAKLCHFANFKTCALMGMVAFFAGAVQAPLTAVIIVMEMTDEHILILPFMVSAFLAQGIAKLFMPEPLYRVLAKRKEGL